MIIRAIIKKSVNFRYKIIFIFIKYITPNLYKKLDVNQFLTNKKFHNKIDNIIIEKPFKKRPAINYMKSLFNNKIVKGIEIGVQKGLNSEYILNQLNIEKLFLIDVWDDYNGSDNYYSDKNFDCVVNKFKNNKKVKIIKNFSVNALKYIPDNSLDFIYIDGNHQYEYVYQDISLWISKLKVNGVMSGHDICLINVRNAVKDFCFNKNIKFKIEIPDWYFIKEGD